MEGAEAGGDQHFVCRSLGSRRITYPAPTPAPAQPRYASSGEGRLVSLTTAQRAIGILQERGLVEGIQGRGLYVAESLPAADQ
jgi:hypothetical protein